ncbi:MAG: M20 family metallopeptidase [Erysipelotrichales bacterium]
MIKDLAQKYFEEVKEIRHQIHMNPEVGLKEFKTSQLIKDTLDKYGIENETLYETGVVGLIKGGKPGKTVLLRADMDALEVDEMADVEYRSTIKGLMHACGHDGHVAGLLGAAMILNEIKDELHGNVKLMFQPDEEKQGGAKPMIDAGILENPKVDAAFGIHLWGLGKRGEVELCSGPMMAAPDEFRVTIKGKGAHAAQPNVGIDPIVMASQVVNGFQTIVSRVNNPLQPLVISTCMFHGGDAFNVIPEYVELAGTVRSFDPEVREMAPQMMEAIVKNITNIYGGSYDYYHQFKYPALINDKAMYELAKKSVIKVSGEDSAIELRSLSMGGEDFAYLCQEVPSCFMLVGISEEDGEPAIHHHPKFAWNDEVLIDTSSYLAQVAIDFLNE